MFVALLVDHCFALIKYVPCVKQFRVSKLWFVQYQLIRLIKSRNTKKTQNQVSYLLFGSHFLVQRWQFQILVQISLIHGNFVVKGSSESPLRKQQYFFYLKPDQIRILFPITFCITFRTYFASSLAVNISGPESQNKGYDTILNCLLKAVVPIYQPLHLK